MALPLTHRALLQVLAVAWLFTGQALWWPGPSKLWSGALALVSTALCLGLFLTPWKRACAAGLAALVAIELAVVPTFFAHNRLFVAALLVTVALSGPGFTWLPRVQVALVYGLAGLDKLLDAAWRDGRFMSSFLEELARFGLMRGAGGDVGAPNALAQWLAANVTSAALLAGSVIALELALAACFLFKWRAGVWLGLAFHVGVYALTGSPMGQFFFAGAAASLLLLRDDEVPPVWGLISITLLVAGPWGHRFVPVAMLGLLILERLRRLSSRAARRST